jgi:hypothetical protein
VVSVEADGQRQQRRSQQHCRGQHARPARHQNRE